MDKSYFNSEVRSVLLLIPELQTFNGNKELIKEISELRRKIDYSVNEVEDILDKKLINEFIDLDDILCERGIPQISLKTVENDLIYNKENIRICLTKYNRHDFYKRSGFKIVRDEIDGITHLIELQINQNYNKIVWKKSEILDENNVRIFDVTVVAPLELVKEVILSIMIDIYTYYILGLSINYKLRHEYSRLKVQYLEDAYGKNKLKDIYHLSSLGNISQDISYLPISLINKPTHEMLNIAKSVEENIKVIKEKLIDFLPEHHTDYDIIISKVTNNKNYNDEYVLYGELKRLDKNIIESIKQRFNHYIGDHETINIYYIEQEESIRFLCFAGIDDILLFYPYFDWYRIVIEKESEDK